MDEKITYWASVAFGVVGLLLLVLMVSLINSNRHMSEEVAQHNVTIQRAVQLSQTNQGLIQLLAQASIKNNNSAIKSLMAEQGITVRQNPDAAPAGTSAPKSDDKKKK